MRYIKKFESNNSLTNLRIGDIVVCIQKDGINSFTLENGESYKIERILKMRDDERKLDDVEKISDYSIEKYYFTLYDMDGGLLLDSGKVGALLFQAIRFTTEYEYSANKYNL